MDDVASVQSLDLPPGFRFHPTDEEIITHYLSPKVINPNFSATAIGEVDLNKCEPWDLPCKAKMGEEWYFFCQRDRKYPTGMRTNRATESGYWKATGKDKEIFRGKGLIVGMKKTLVFYKGRAPKGHKSNWVMHEFRLQAKSQLYSNISNTSKDDWTVCRVFHKKMGIKKGPMLIRMNNFDEFFSDLNNSNNIPGSSPIDDETLDFKGNMMMMMMDDKSLFIPNYHHQPGAGQLPFYPQIQNPNDPGSSSSGYNMRPDHTMLRDLNGALPSLAIGHYEVDRFSNRSVVSADRKPEISSAVSKTGDDLDNILSYAGPSLNFENMWNC